MPVARRTARRSSPGSTTVVAPSSLASSRWAGCLAAATIGPARVKRRSAAMVSRPEGARADHDHGRPVGVAGGGQRAVHRARGRLDHDRGLVAHVGGHRRAAGSGGRPSAWTSRRRCRSRTRSAGPARGRRRRCARSCPGRPARTPRTSARCRGSRSRAPARARRGRCRRFPRGRPRPRGRARRGTTRSARSSGTTAPSMVARSLPQMPARRGLMRTQSGPGSSGGSMSRRRSGPTRAPAPGTARPATMAAA